MQVKGFFKPLRMTVWFAALALSGCSDSVASGESKWTFFSSFSRKPAPLEQIQTPWRLTLQGLSEAQLLSLGSISESRPATSPTSPSTTTIAIKLRLQSQDPKLGIGDLLPVQAPAYSPDQAQNALFYHMAEAGYLHLADQEIRPVTAYVEMTTQRDQYLDIVFIFSLARPALEQADKVRFVLDKAFFLSQPVEFSLSATQLLPAS